MTPDMDTPVWMLLLVAAGLWLLWAAVRAGDRRRSSSIRLVVVLTQSGQNGALDDRAQDQDGHHQPKQRQRGDEDGEQRERVGHGASVSAGDPAERIVSAWDAMRNNHG